MVYNRKEHRLLFSMAASEVFKNLPPAAQSAIFEAQIKGAKFFRNASSGGIPESFISEFRNFVIRFSIDALLNQLSDEGSLILVYGSIEEANKTIAAQKQLQGKKTKK